jgi:Protein of unknown function (DUF2934)
MSAQRQKPEPMPKPATAVPSHDEIERRAFEIFKGRGEEPGDPTQDWLEAEKQLREEARHGAGRRASRSRGPELKP